MCLTGAPVTDRGAGSWHPALASVRLISSDRKCFPRKKKKRKREKQRLPIPPFFFFCFPIRRRGMISLLARAKSYAERVCRFLAVNEQTRNPIERTEGGEVIRVRSPLIIASLRQKMEEIALYRKGLEQWEPHRRFLMACSFISKIVSLLELCMLTGASVRVLATALGTGGIRGRS